MCGLLAQESYASSPVRTNAEHVLPPGSPGQGSFYRSQHERIIAWKVGTGDHVNAFGLGAHGRMRAGYINESG
jgi:hypothetical protein